MNSKALFILGAGASHGASIQPYCGIKPPLLKDFFNTFIKLNYFSKYEKRANELFAFLYKEFQWTKEALASGTPDLEIVLDNIDEALDKIRSKLENEIIYRKYVKLSSLKGFIVDHLIPEALHRTTWEGHGLNPPKCSNHEALAKNLNPNDIIINLNYDLIMDTVLVNNGWNWVKGYALPFAYCYRNNLDKWEATTNYNDKTNFYYLKLHGSLNWFHASGAYEELGTITLKSRSLNTADKWHVANPICWYGNHNLRGYQYGARTCDSNTRYFVQPLIVGPGRKRECDMLKALWNIAEEQLKDVKEVFVIGCSIRENDRRLFALLKNSISWSTLKRFVVVDPDEQCKRRLENIFEKKIDCYFQSLQEFSEFLGGLPGTRDLPGITQKFFVARGRDL